MALSIPFFNYNAHFDWWQPAQAPEQRAIIGKAVERVDLDTGGDTPQRHSVLIGNRNYIDVEYRWIYKTDRALFFTMWDAIKDGSEFEFGEHDTVPKCGDGTECGDGSTCGLRADGHIQPRYICTMESVDPNITPDEVWDYYRVAFRMRVLQALNE